jgi:hypothetical protein
MSRYILKTDNKTTQFFVYVGIFLFAFGIARFDTENISFEHNERAYFMFLAALISLVFSYFRIRKERALQNKESGK